MRLDDLKRWYIRVGEDLCPVDAGIEGVLREHPRRREADASNTCSADLDRRLRSRQLEGTLPP